MEVKLRDPNTIMKLSRLGSFHQSKLSFLRSFLDEFKDWDLTDSAAANFMQSDPKFFKTLNLMNIIGMIDDVANEEFKPTKVASIAMNFELEK